MRRDGRTFAYSIPSRGERGGRNKKRRKKRGCGRRGEEWGSLFDKNVAAKGEAE